jgi:hypothetical protein
MKKPVPFYIYFHQKNFGKKCWPKIYLGQDLDPEPDPDPDVFKNRIRIRSKIVRIRNTAFWGSEICSQKERGFNKDPDPKHIPVPVLKTAPFTSPLHMMLLPNPPPPRRGAGKSASFIFSGSGSVKICGRRNARIPENGLL